MNVWQAGISELEKAANREFRHSRVKWGGFALYPSEKARGIVYTQVKSRLTGQGYWKASRGERTGTGATPQEAALALMR